LRSIRFGLIVIAVSGLIVLAAGVEVAIWSRQGEALAKQEESVGKQMLVLRHTNEALVELESGQRGYLLTGDGTYLDFYNQARRDLAVALTALDKEFAADTQRSADIAEVTRLARAKEDEAARSVQLRLEGRQTAALDAAIADEGRPLREAARTTLHSLADQLRVALADLDGQQTEKFRHIYALLAVVVLVVDISVIVAIMSLSTSIQRMREQQREEEHKAMHDTLTSLPNRRYLSEWLAMALSAARRGGQPLAVLYFDLDGFKSVNDRFGHEAGDRVLQVTATRLRQTLRTSDFVARLGGDEFVAVLPDVSSVPEVSMLIQRLQTELVKAPIAEVEDGTVSASIGTAWFPENGDTVDALLAAADHAMYEAKQTRKAARSPRLDAAESEHGRAPSPATHG
jgi:diguanylate cyclase (GGDEF)-like protein